MTARDATHDPTRQSWVPSAAAHAEFPIQNLPYGVSSSGAAAGHIVVAISTRWPHCCPPTGPLFGKRCHWR
jgi:fumarylacetoacetase